MKKLIIIVGLSLLTCSVDAQQAGRRGERVHSIKIGYLTDRLHLTPVQAATFWPVYDDYEADIKDARKAFRQKYRDGGAGSESEAEAGRFIDDNLDFQEQMLAINRQYKDKMLKVISAQQLATLYEAEKDFKKLLLQQLRDRRRRDGVR